MQQRGEGGVQGRGERHLATAGLNYPAAECTGACVLASVYVCVCVCVSVCLCASVCVKLRHRRGRAETIGARRGATGQGG